jgi:drug/metabolite transporter (DMT)-like permease
MRYAVQTLPPYLLAGTRFLIAGAVLYAWVRWRGAPRPTLKEWRGAAMLGTLLLFLGNGHVVWASQRVPSGVASLLVATVPLWVVVFNWARPGGIRPSGRVVIGLVAGFSGIVLLVGPGKLTGGNQIDSLGAAVLSMAAICWGVGSVYTSRIKLPPSPLMAAAAEMLAGGAVLVVASVLTGEPSRVVLSAVSLRSLISFVYLIIFGSWVGFTAYIWLLNATTPARAATYAYVNPLIAVLLGWALADEPLSARTLLATAMIVPAVALIISHRTPTAEPSQEAIIVEAAEAEGSGVCHAVNLQRQGGERSVVPAMSEKI